MNLAKYAKISKVQKQILELLSRRQATQPKVSKGRSGLATKNGKMYLAETQSRKEPQKTLVFFFSACSASLRENSLIPSCLRAQVPKNVSHGDTAAQRKMPKG
jgi:hypothetical protein